MTVPITIYFDWSIRNGVFTLANDQDQVQVYPTLEHVLKTLHDGDRLVGEATFESFNLTQRYLIIDMARDMGVDLLTTPTRLTGRTRRRMGYEGKSDEIDVFVIRAIAQDPSKLKRPHRPDPEMVALRERTNERLMDLRRTGTLTEKPRTPGRFNFTSDKDHFADQLIQHLPLYEDQPLVRRLALGNGRGYSKITVAAVGVASIEARTTREFDRLTGMYAHAYPSQIRADLHHWAWAGGNTRAKLNDHGKRDDLAMSDFRRECRWLYHQMKVFV